MTLSDVVVHGGVAAPAQGSSARARWLWLAGGLTALVLVLTVGNQIYDLNYYALFEATALLAGDRPYRDFYNWGAPLPSFLSALAQLLSGNRLIGEFALQWICITTGAVLSFHMGLRLSRSILASGATFLLTLIVLVGTPTEHYPKLVVYPLALWLAWRYLDAPSAGRSAALGVMTAFAFLLRHDHGVHVAFTAAVALTLARVTNPDRAWRASGNEAVRYGVAAILAVAPWLVLVHAGEGLPQYVRERAALYENWSVKTSPFRTLLTFNPVRTFAPESVPPPQASTVSFTWGGDINDARRRELEREYHLSWMDGPDAEGRWTYDVANIHDTRLLVLARSINDARGFNWEHLERLRSKFPTEARAVTWLLQITLAVPLLLLGSVAIDVLHAWRHAEPASPSTVRTLLAATLLILACNQVLLQPSYFAAVAPLTAAMGAQLLVWHKVSGHGTATQPPFPRLRAVLTVLRAAAGAIIVIGSAVASLSFARLSAEPLEVIRHTRPAFSQLLASPPIEGVLAADQVSRYTREMWDRGEIEIDRQALLLRYVHDCSTPGDRLLVTGSTPSHVNYLAARPFAGGHVLWHHRWRSDPEGEAQSLRLLQQQSVPFVFSSTDPVFEDFEHYPKIHEYLTEHYVQLEGSDGLLLIDARRKPVRAFAALGFPCF